MQDTPGSFRGNLSKKHLANAIEYYISSEET